MRIKFLGAIDIILIIAVLLLAIYTIKKTFISKADKDYIVIETHEKKYVYPLEENRTIEIQGKIGKSVIEIKSGKARFLKSPCPNKLCVKESYAKNFPVTCLPQGISIYYKNKESEIDALCR